MARSVKKGPFADASLLKKVDAMNAAGDKSVIKTWSVSYTHLCWNIHGGFGYCGEHCESGDN